MVWSIWSYGLGGTNIMKFLKKLEQLGIAVPTRRVRSRSILTQAEFIPISYGVGAVTVRTYSWDIISANI